MNSSTREIITTAYIELLTYIDIERESLPITSEDIDAYVSIFTLAFLSHKPFAYDEYMGQLSYITNITSPDGISIAQNPDVIQSFIPTHSNNDLVTVKSVQIDYITSTIKIDDFLLYCIGELEQLWSPYFSADNIKQLIRPSQTSKLFCNIFYKSLLVNYIIESMYLARLALQYQYYDEVDTTVDMVDSLFCTMQWYNICNFNNIHTFQLATPSCPHLAIVPDIYAYDGIISINNCRVCELK